MFDKVMAQGFSEQSHAFSAARLVDDGIRLVCASCCCSIFHRQRRLRKRKLPIANGSFMGAQLQSFADPLAVMERR
jgi:hypothetical protein